MARPEFCACALDAVAWCRAQLPRNALELIATFRITLELQLDDHNTLFLFHGSPESNTADLLATTPPELLDQMLAGRHTAVMAGGHTQIQMLRQRAGHASTSGGGGAAGSPAASGSMSAAGNATAGSKC